MNAQDVISAVSRLEREVGLMAYEGEHPTLRQDIQILIDNLKRGCKADVNMFIAFAVAGGRTVTVRGLWGDELDRTGHTEIAKNDSSFSRKGGILLPTRQAIILEIP